VGAVHQLLCEYSIDIGESGVDRFDNCKAWDGGARGAARSGLIVTGCGGDDDDTTTTPGQSAEQQIDSAVQSCTDSAENLGGATGSAVQTACQQVGEASKQDLSSAGADVRKTLSETAATCRKAVNRLPSGDAQDVLSSLCDAVESAGQTGD
jgi:hypothetical protein